MAQSKKVKPLSHILLLAAIGLLFFLPFLARPQILSSKNNDLGRTYVPLYSSIRNSFLTYKSIPLWRSDQMMGESLIANPLSSILYPGNIIFLIFPTSMASVIYYFLHFLLALVATFYLGKSFGFKRLQSMAAALFYTFSTNMLLHVSAGHITMVAAFSYLPIIFLSIRRLLKDTALKWLVVGSVSLASTLILYATIFYYSAIFSFVYTVYFFIFNQKLITFQKLTNQIKLLLALVLLTLGLSAIELFPQILFGPQSTRSALTYQDVALPLFNFKRYIVSMLFPYLDFKNLDHESFLYLGLVPSALALWGFLYLSSAKKIFVGILGTVTILFTLGQSTPVFKIAYYVLPLLKYSRMTTRLWFVVALVVTLLAAYALGKFKNQKLIYLLIILFLAENLSIGYFKIFQTPDLKNSNENLYQYLSSDKDIFRIYCTTYCFNPQLLEKYRLQIINGESPIQDKNFVSFLSQAGGYSWDQFAVIFPPYQVWQVSNPPQPNVNLMGLANVKYVASTYPLYDNNLQLQNKFENIFLYKNLLYRKRAYFENSSAVINFQKYEPNRIILTFASQDTPRKLVFSENYTSGWIASQNFQDYKAEPENGIFRAVTILPGISSVEFKYQPEGFIIGKTITMGTIVFLVIFFWYTRKKLI